MQIFPADFEMLSPKKGVFGQEDCLVLSVHTPKVNHVLLFYKILNIKESNNLSLNQELTQFIPVCLVQFNSL